jgi:hypothetical protein
MKVSCRETLRCLLKRPRGLSTPGAGPRAAGKSGISQARRRLGLQPVKRLHDETVATNAAGDPIGIEILNAGTFVRDSVLESVQARVLDLPEAKSA